VRWFVDGNNVMGSRPDGWWNDPAAAKARLTQEVAQWCRGHDDPVTLVFDRPVAPAAGQLAGGNLTVEFAARSGRDAADHRIVELVESALADRTDDAEGIDGTAPGSGSDPDLIVVTADRGLIDRLPPGVATVGPGRFRDRIAEQGSG
jgi:hypothetical protein